MRIKHKVKPVKGDKKTSIKYLIFPKRIKEETRWLEFSKILYNREYVTVSYDMGGVEELQWVAKEFLPFDPVYDCDTFIKKGCAHVDGMLCDMDDCGLFKPV